MRVPRVRLQRNFDFYRTSFCRRNNERAAVQEKGDAVRVTQRKDEWWKGVNARGAKGWFPAGRVVPATKAEAKALDAVRYNNDAVLIVCVVQTLCVW